VAKCLCSGLAIACFCACSVGSEPMMTTSALSVGSVGVESGDDGESVETTAIEDESADADVGEAESTTAEDGDASTSMDASTDEGSSSGSTEDTGDPPMCPAASTCQTATVIGEVSGDEGSDALQVDGAEPTWVSFQVTEDNGSVSGEALEFTATLTSPVGYDFDLYVYRGPEGGNTGCNGELSQSTSAGPSDVVHMSWGEGAIADGGDERAWVAVEVVAKNGMCDENALWTLVVEGDT
jgi:hypothetical protein